MGADQRRWPSVSGRSPPTQLNAGRDIPPEQVRLHVCWGDAALPHIYDILMRDIVGIVLDARSAAVAFEATNPPHEHEWMV